MKMNTAKPMPEEGPGHGITSGVSSNTYLFLSCTWGKHLIKLIHLISSICSTAEFQCLLGGGMNWQVIVRSAGAVAAILLLQ